MSGEFETALACFQSIEQCLSEILSINTIMQSKISAINNLLISKGITTESELTALTMNEIIKFHKQNAESQISELK